MKRSAYQHLLNWKSKSDRKPLIIQGARQVGKTWLMKKFGQLEYKKVAYINFDNNQRMQILFQADLNPQRLIQGLELESGLEIEAENTLLIFDEIQECPQALKSLKYFNELAPKYDILAAGSLLGVSLHRNSSFPVGKVSFLSLYPLNFSEFLEAMGDSKLLNPLIESQWDLVRTFKDKYLQRLKEYTFTGGMPEVVHVFKNGHNFGEARKTQLNILKAYEQDFSKHAPHAINPRLRGIWNSIPSQLSKENKKFLYGLIREGARAKDYELALTWLLDTGLILKVPRISKPALPLNSYEDLKAFKIYLIDIGLLGAMCRLDKKVLLEEQGPFEEFKGALAEQYVCQELVAQCQQKPYYWSAPRGSSEIDFILQSRDKIIPLEVKATVNLKAKSLKSYTEKYHPPHALRLSLSNFKQSQNLTDIPLYATPVLNKYL